MDSLQLAYTLSGGIEEAAEFFKAMQVKPVIACNDCWVG